MSGEDDSEYEYGTDSGMGYSMYSLTNEWTTTDIEIEKALLRKQAAIEGAQYSVNEKTFLPATNEVMAIKFLNETQSKALRYCVERASALSKAAEMGLSDRLQALGYPETALRDLQLYIRDQAPIIIHVSGGVIDQFLQHDEYYRNCFEISTPLGDRSNDNDEQAQAQAGFDAGCGYSDDGGRFSWEHNMFDGLYDQSTPFQRVKYGCLNISRDPAGVQCAYGYGECYLQLRNVRLRTTFAAGDTGDSTYHVLATCEHYTHILDQYTAEDLQMVMDIVTNKVAYCSSAVMSQYKEIQLHGPIKLNRDIEAVVVTDPHHLNMDAIRAFARKNKIALRFMDGTEERVDPETNETTTVRWLDELSAYKPAIGGLGVAAHTRTTEDSPAMFHVVGSSLAPSTSFTASTPTVQETGVKPAVNDVLVSESPTVSDTNTASSSMFTEDAAGRISGVPPLQEQIVDEVNAAPTFKQSEQRYCSIM